MQNENNDCKKPIKLEDIQKKNVFKVPDTYFEQLPREIQTKIIAQNKTWQWDWSFLAAHRVAWAAMLILLIASGIVFVNIRNTDTTTHIASTKEISRNKLNKLNSDTHEGDSVQPDFSIEKQKVNTPNTYLKNAPQPIENIAQQIQDSTTTRTVAIEKIDALTIIASLDKQDVSSYLKEADGEEYECEEVSAKL